MSERIKNWEHRLDDYLEQLPDGRARLSCLMAQRTKFEAEYVGFQRKVAAGVDVGETTAWDYTETLAIIDARIGKMEKAA